MFLFPNIFIYLRDKLSLKYANFIFIRNILGDVHKQGILLRLKQEAYSANCLFLKHTIQKMICKRPTFKNLNYGVIFTNNPHVKWGWTDWLLKSGMQIECVLITNYKIQKMPESNFWVLKSCHQGYAIPELIWQLQLRFRHTEYIVWHYL